MALGHLRESGTFLRRVTPVVALHPAEPGGGELSEHLVEPGRLKSERKGMGKNCNCP